MIVSTILLTRDNYYVKADGTLPERPSWDKALLTSLCKGKVISEEAYHMLPKSITKNTVHSDAFEPEIGITIPEIDALTDILIISRSNEIVHEGKQFRLTNFKPIVQTTNIEIWERL